MAYFAYKGRNAGGQLVEGGLEAASSGAVADLLIGQGLVPVEIREAPGGAKGGANLNITLFKPRVSHIDLLLFSRQLHTLLKAGVPILCSMGAANKLDPTAFRVADIEKTTVDPLAKVIRLECRKRRLGKVKVVFSEELTLPPLQEEIEEAPTAARRTVPASNAFVPAACGLVCGSEVVKDLLRKAGVYRGKK